MATTEELEKEILAEMAADPVAYAARPVKDVITIDGETRVISVPASELLFGVETDKDVERKHFRCPRVVGDGIDLSKHQIYISYITSDSTGKSFSGDSNLYLCEDVAVDDDDITFSWQLSANVFTSAGFIAFKVLAAKTDGENVQTRWNTVPAVGTVLMTVPDGMDISETYPDIVTQLLERMASVEKIATEEAMQGYVNTYLEAHPADIDETLTDHKKAAPADVVGKLKEEIDDIAVKEYAEMQVEFIEGSYIPYFNQHTITENSNAKYLKISCKSGEKYKIHTKNFYDGRAYALYSGETEGATDYYLGTELTEVTEEIVIPKDVTTLVVNSELSFPAKVEKYVINNKNYYAEKKIMESEIMRNRHDLEDKTKNLKYWNLIDISKVKEGYGYTDSIGCPPTLIAQDSFNAIDDVIPCKAGETYTVNWLYGAIGIYDSGIKRIQHIHIDSIPKTFVVPDGGCYMTLFGGALRMTDIMLVKGDTLPKKYVPYNIFDIKTREYANLFGVKWCAYGDSLTDSATLTSQTTGTKNYVDYVSESLGLKVVNCGVGGTGYMKTENRFVNRVSTIPEDTELLTVFGSFNDYEYIESSLGVFGDSDTDTIYGCMKSFFDSVFSRCPDIVVGVILSTKWGYLSPQKDSEASKKCDLYIKALQEIADYYDLPVLNLYNYSNLRPWDDVFAERYYKDDDGNGVANTVHPLDAAHKRFIAPKVEAFIKRIYHVY